MTSNKITGIALTAVAGFALLRYFQMSPEERQSFIQGVKERLHELLDDIDSTRDRAQSYMTQLKSTSEDNWLDKLVVVKKIIDEVKPAREAGAAFGKAASAQAQQAH